jgi:hypothetical protein
MPTVIREAGVWVQVKTGMGMVFSGDSEVGEDAIGPNANKSGIRLDAECREKTDAVEDSAHG